MLTPPKLTWPHGFFVTYDHLVTGEMIAIRENGAASGTGALASFAYDDLGRRTTRSGWISPAPPTI